MQNESMKKFCLLLVVVFLSGSLFAQGVRYANTVFTSGGFPFATIRVCTEPATGTPCTPLASIYSDPGLTVPIIQPFTADANGNFSFFANPASTYHVQVSGIGLTTYDIPYITLGGGGASAGSTTYCTSLSCLTGAIQSNATIRVSNGASGAYNVAAPVHIFNVHNLLINCDLGVTFTATSSIAEMFFLDDNSGASSGNTQIRFTGCNFNANSLATNAVLVESYANPTTNVTIDNGTCTGALGHCLYFQTFPAAGGPTTYLTEFIYVNHMSFTSVAPSFAGFRLNYVQNAHTDHLSCPEGSLGANSSCASGNGVVGWEDTAMDARDYVGDTTSGDKGTGEICVFCVNVIFHDSLANSKYGYQSAQCGTNIFCAVGFYLDTNVNSQISHVTVTGGTMGAFLEVNRAGSFDHDHIYFPGVYGLWVDSRQGNTTADTTLANALTSTTGLTAGSVNWALSAFSGAPGSVCSYNAQTSYVQATATGAPSGAVLSQDFGSDADWRATPMISLCVNVSVAVNAGVLQLVLGAGSSPFGGHTVIPLPALQPGWTPLELWDKYWPLNWFSPGAGQGVRSWGINAVSAVPSGLVISASQFIHEVWGSGSIVDHNTVIRPGETGIEVAGALTNFMIDHNVVTDIGWTTNNSSICGILVDATTLNQGNSGASLVPHTAQNGLITENTLAQTVNTGGGSGNTLGVCLKASATGGSGGTPQPVSTVRVYKNQYPGSGFNNLASNFQPCLGAACATDFQEIPGDVENGLNAKFACTVTGFGSSGTCNQYGTNEVGYVKLVASGSGVTSSGTVTITYTTTYPGNTGPSGTIPTCVWTLSNQSNDWNARATLIDNSNTSQYLVDWDNNSVNVATSMYLNYHCSTFRTSN